MLFKLMLFPSNAVKKSVILGRLYGEIIVFSTAVTPSREQTLRLHNYLVYNQVDEYCQNCSLLNYGSVYEKIQTKLLEKLTNVELRERAIQTLVECRDDYAKTKDEIQVLREKPDLLLRRLDIHTQALRSRIKSYYEKRHNKCPGNSQMVSLFGEEADMLKSPCRAGYKVDEEITVTLPPLLWMQKSAFTMHEDSSVYAQKPGFYLFNAERSTLVDGARCDMSHVEPYRLTNIYEDGRICWGDVSTPSDIRTAQNEFFCSVFNGDLAPVRNRRRTRSDRNQYPYTTEYEHLQNYDGSEYIPDSIVSIFNDFARTHEVQCPHAVGVVVFNIPSVPANFFTISQCRIGEGEHIELECISRLTVALVTRYDPTNETIDIEIPYKDLSFIKIKELDINSCMSEEDVTDKIQSRVNRVRRLIEYYDNSDISLDTLKESCSYYLDKDCSFLNNLEEVLPFLHQDLTTYLNTLYDGKYYDVPNNAFVYDC